MRFGEMGLAEAAEQAAGNWREFECFAWHRARDLNDADDWAIVYTHNRDSGLLDRSNASVIEAALEPFTKGRTPDVVPEHHHHWACGWIDGYSIRVFKRKRTTKAFRAYYALSQRLVQHPVLDEQDYSARQYEATIRNLPDAAWRLKREFNLPDGWEAEVHGWLSDNKPGAIEDTDDRGGWPDETELRAAFEGLGYEQMAVA